MSENYTAVQVRNDLKKKLNEIKKATGKTYNDILEELLQETYQGVEADDVITITRDSVAFTLKYWETENPSKVKVRDVTYQELKCGIIGDKFTANDNPVSAGFVNSVAEIVYKNNDDVILLVREIHKGVDNRFSSVSSVVHVNVF